MRGMTWSPWCYIFHILSSPKSVDGSYLPHTWHHTCTQMMKYFSVSIKPSVSRYKTNVLSWFEWPVKHDMFSSFSSHPSTSAGGIESIRHKFTNDWSSICATSPSSSLVLTFTMDSKPGSLASPWTFTTKVWWRDHATLPGCCSHLSQFRVIIQAGNCCLHFFTAC